jgi:hypothetical protein
LCSPATPAEEYGTLGGYIASTSATGENTLVTECSTVAGQHANLLGQILVLPVELAFIGATRLRQEVQELESLCSTRAEVVIHDPYMCDVMQKHLGVEIYSCRCSAVQIEGILSTIRFLSVQEPSGISQPERPGSVTSTSKQDDTILLLQSINGVAIELRALWRRWRGPNPSPGG